MVMSVVSCTLSSVVSVIKHRVIPMRDEWESRYTTYNECLLIANIATLVDTSIRAASSSVSLVVGVAMAVAAVLCFVDGLVLERLERCGVEAKKQKEKRNDGPLVCFKTAERIHY